MGTCASKELISPPHDVAIITSEDDYVYHTDERSLADYHASKAARYPQPAPRMTILQLMVSMREHSTSNCGNEQSYVNKTYY